MPESYTVCHSQKKCLNYIVTLGGPNSGICPYKIAKMIAYGQDAPEEIDICPLFQEYNGPDSRENPFSILKGR